MKSVRGLWIRIGCGRWTSIHPLPSLLFSLSVLIPALLSVFINLSLKEIGREKLEASRSAIDQDYMNSRTSIHAHNILANI